MTSGSFSPRRFPANNYELLMSLILVCPLLFIFAPFLSIDIPFLETIGTIGPKAASLEPEIWFFLLWSLISSQRYNMPSDFRNGWAARRANKCDSDENGEHTWGKWQTCCPAGMVLTVDTENNTGCSFGDAPATYPEQCADPDLVLWYDDYGMFCCDADLHGFARKKDHYKGCATQDEFNEMFAAGNLTNISQKARSPAPTASATTLTSQTLEPTTAPRSSSNSESQGSRGSSRNTGAIAGGVVGGACGTLLVLGLIWFFLRRRRSSSVKKHDVLYTSSEP